MTQPSFVPISEADQVRPARRLSISGHWAPERPGDHRAPVRLTQPLGGTPGPDQGFALRLARRFEDRLVLTEGENPEDVLVGAAMLAACRAGLFGRAPSVYDLEVALSLFGFLAEAPDGLVARRKALFASAAHDYVVQRRLVEAVPESTLRLSPAEVEADSAEWERLLPS